MKLQCHRHLLLHCVSGVFKMAVVHILYKPTVHLENHFPPERFLRLTLPRFLLPFFISYLLSSFSLPGNSYFSSPHRRHKIWSASTTLSKATSPTLSRAFYLSKHQHYTGASLVSPESNIKVHVATVSSPAVIRVYAPSFCVPRVTLGCLAFIRDVLRA